MIEYEEVGKLLNWKRPKTLVKDPEIMRKIRISNPDLQAEIQDVQQIVDRCSHRYSDPALPKNHLSLEMHQLLNYDNGCSAYTIVDKIGEGTFSSVYKAVDEWYWQTVRNQDDATQNPTAWHEAVVHTQGAHFYLPRRYVAIKRIYSTSCPNRVHSELDFMMRLNGEHNVVSLLSVLRNNDQIVAIMPYFEHVDFRIYMHVMTLDDIRNYCKQIFEALTHVHSLRIIHRDIKPSNFLYDLKTGRGLLVDFGLAQNERDLISDKRVEAHRSKRQKTGENDTGADQKFVEKQKVQEKLVRRVNASSKVQKQAQGYFAKDSRPAIRAARAGTRGFRGPEVLFKVQEQTIAIDVWSVGVIMLSLLTRQFPFFNSQDDMDGLVEIATIFGNKLMKATAEKYDRTWLCCVPTVPEDRLDWMDIVEVYNPVLLTEYGYDKVSEAVDLMNECLTLDCDKRITAKQAGKHPFITQADIGSNGGNSCVDVESGIGLAKSSIKFD